MHRNFWSFVVSITVLSLAGFTLLTPGDASAQVGSRGVQNFSCVVAVSTATTVQAVGGECVAPGVGRRFNITDVSFGSSAASGTAADSFPTIKEGTNGTCGVSTSVVWEALSTANTTVVDNITTPITVDANSELCWIMTTAGSKTITIRGFITRD